MEYFLTIDGERTGPLTQFQVIERIRDGRLRGSELAWHRGLDNWKPVREIADFSGYWQPSPVQVAEAENVRRVARAALDAPQPWPRFWARMLDYIWFGFALGMGVSAVLPESTLKWIMLTSLKGAPWHCVSLLLFVPFEAWCLSRYGTTPGKALLRIQIRREDGALPTFPQALTRSALVFIKGIALGLFPIVQAVAMSLQRIWLLQAGQSSWDRECHTHVEHGEPELWRHLVVAAVMIALALALAGGVLMSRELAEAARPGAPE